MVFEMRKCWIRGFTATWVSRFSSVTELLEVVIREGTLFKLDQISDPKQPFSAFFEEGGVKTPNIEKNPQNQVNFLTFSQRQFWPKWIMVQIKRVNMGWDPVGTSNKVSGWFEGPFEQLATGNEVENFEKKIRIFFDLHRVPVEMNKKIDFFLKIFEFEPRSKVLKRLHKTPRNSFWGPYRLPAHVHTLIFDHDPFWSKLPSTIFTQNNAHWCYLANLSQVWNS